MGIRTLQRMLIAGSLLLFCSVALWWWHDYPRRTALACLNQLDRALQSNGSGGLKNLIITPAAIQGRSEAEQNEFLSKALTDEISDAGLKALKRHGRFGSLRNLFPQEAQQWAAQAGVNADDCMAFRMEREGIRAEVVLSREGNQYRILRCNNVKQMAGGI